MNANTKDVVMYDSPEAATPHTMSGWKSRDGYFYADERTARYAGCTHRPCEKCGAITEKHWLSCRDCRRKAETDRFLAMPQADWDGASMLVCGDTYYQDFESIVDFMRYNDATAEGMEIIICTPNTVRPIDAGDIFEDLIPEDGDIYSLPSKVLEAFDVLNSVIVACKDESVSWSPGKYRLSDANLAELNAMAKEVA